MNSIVKSMVALCAITTVCVSVLAFVNEITREPILLQQQQIEIQAYERIFANADNFEQEHGDFPEGDVVTGVITAYAGEDRLGYIIRAAQRGYGGTINMLVGIDTDGILTGVAILSHSETPGLGALIENPSFTEQFRGRGHFPLTVVKTSAVGENEIDVITSATISTRAVTEAVNAAHEWFSQKAAY